LSPIDQSINFYSFVIHVCLFHSYSLDHRINYICAVCIHHLQVQSVLNSKVVKCGIIYLLIYLYYRRMFHSSVNLRTI